MRLALAAGAGLCCGGEGVEGALQGWQTWAVASGEGLDGRISCGGGARLWRRRRGLAAVYGGGDLCWRQNRVSGVAARAKEGLAEGDEVGSGWWRQEQRSVVAAGARLCLGDGSSAWRWRWMRDWPVAAGALAGLGFCYGGGACRLWRDATRRWVGRGVADAAGEVVDGGVSGAGRARRWRWGRGFVVAAGAGLGCVVGDGIGGARWRRRGRKGRRFAAAAATVVATRVGAWLSIGGCGRRAESEGGA